MVLGTFNIQGGGTFPKMFTTLSNIVKPGSHVCLKDVVAEHLDHLHYINDILMLNIDSLNRVLTDHLLNRLFIPLYIYSFARSSIPSEDMKPYVSPVVALFLLCQVTKKY